MSRELSRLHGVDTVAGHVGRAVLGDQTVDANSGELWVQHQVVGRLRRHARLHRATSCAATRVCTSSVTTYPKSRINAVLRTSDGMQGKDLTVRVFGENLGTPRSARRRGWSARLGQDRRRHRAPRRDARRRSRRSRSRSTSTRPRRSASSPVTCAVPRPTVLSGLRVGFLFEEQKVFDVVVWGTPATRNSIDARQQPADRPPRRSGPGAPRRRRQRADGLEPDGHRPQGRVRSARHRPRRQRPQRRRGRQRRARRPSQRGRSRSSTTPSC